MAESMLRELSMNLAVDIIKLCGTIRRILIASVNTAKNNQ